MFNNREQAGYLLANKLIDYTNSEDTVVVAIPRGAVPIGAIIAEKLNLPLDIVLSKKIGHPLNKEYAIGAVIVNSSTLNNDILGISKKYIEEETQKIRIILKKRNQQYYGTNQPLSLKNKTIILIDDGVATGSTLLSSVELIHKENPTKIIVALPVAPFSVYEKMNKNPYR